MGGAERSHGAPASPVVDAKRVSRLAVIADVHGNASALAAVVDELRRAPPELVVVNGDLSWGPEPEETLALANDIGNAVFVRGNAESALLRLTAARDDERSEVGRWMLERHTPERLAEIGRFTGAVAVEVEGVGHVFCCHGSPRGDQEIVTPRTPESRMEALLEGVRLDVLATAHVHLQFERRVLGITSMNAGSVGLPYGASPAAYWAELGPDVRLRRTPYDVDEAIRRTEQSGIPTAERLVGYLREPPAGGRGDRRRRAARGVRLGRSQLDCRQAGVYPRSVRCELRATFRAKHGVADAQDELSAHEALEARATD